MKQPCPIAPLKKATVYTQVIVVIDVNLLRVRSSLLRNMKQAHFYDIFQSHTV